MPDTQTIAPPALIRKLDESSRRFDELHASMNDPAVLSNSQKLVAISKEAGQLDPLVARYKEYQAAARQVEELTEMASHKGDAEMSELAASELPDATAKAEAMLEALKDEFVA